MAKGKTSHAKDGREAPPGNGQGKPALDPDYMAQQIRGQLEQLNRAVFHPDLADALAVRPSAAARQQFADRFPDRRAQEIAILSRLSGFSDEIKVAASLALRVDTLSDVQLAAEYADLRRQLEAQERVPLEPEGKRKAIEAGPGEGDAEQREE